MRAANRKREKALGARGVNLNQDAMVLMQLRALKELVLGDDPAMETAYAIAYQAQVSDAFDSIEAEINRAKLTAPANGKVLQLPRLRDG